MNKNTYTCSFTHSCINTYTHKLFFRGINSVWIINSLVLRHTHCNIDNLIWMGKTLCVYQSHWLVTGEERGILLLKTVGSSTACVSKQFKSRSQTNTYSVLNMQRAFDLARLPAQVKLGVYCIDINTTGKLTSKCIQHLQYITIKIQQLKNKRLPCIHFR